MQEIYLTLSPLVVKYLTHHIKGFDGVMVLDLNNKFTKVIYEYIQYAPNGYKSPTSYNLALRVNYNRYRFYRGKIDPRYHALHITPENQEAIDCFFKKFINLQFNSWCYEKRQLLKEVNAQIKVLPRNSKMLPELYAEKKTLELRALAERFKSEIGLTEDDLSSDALLVSYDRWVKRYKTPAQYIAMNVNTFYFKK